MAGEWWRAAGRRVDTWRSTLARVLVDWYPHPLSLVAVGSLAGVAVVLVAISLFPYHSLNHDEGVYLQQAAMLLEGQLQLRPPVPDAVRPWFFVRDGGRLYPKYAPVTGAVYAPGVALGVPRLVLGAVAGGNAVLVGLLAREAFDWRTGVVAAALLTTAPLFLLSSAVFLSYAPTTLLNLLFALSYVRAHRRGSRRYAALAGIAVGLAFFSRPYTALLFALPFLGHAAFVLGTAWRERLRENEEWGLVSARTVSIRLGIVAALGTVFVGLTLAYNWVLTGDPFVFPYEAFAPEDGIGFGHRQILGHQREYTPALAVRANRRVLWQFLTTWGPLGAVGTALAAVGLVAGLGRPNRDSTVLEKPDDDRRFPSSDDQRLPSADDRRFPSDVNWRFPSDVTVRWLITALVITVPAGNVLFWGNLNILGAVDNPTDGLIAVVGPFYHFDLLVPAAVFGAAAIVVLADRVLALSDRIDRPAVRTASLMVVLLASLAVGGVVEASILADPVERNADHRDDLETVYEPFETTDRSNALVFVPTPYGDWLNHPFQRLRNEPGFDGDEVYVLDRGPDGDAASLAAFPDRQLYRFTYRGQWRPDEDGITPVLEPLAVREGNRLEITTRLGTVGNAQGATVRLETDDEAVQYGFEQLRGETETVRWTVNSESARIDPDGLHRFSDADRVAVDAPTTVSLVVTYTQPGGSSITYRQDLTVVGTDAGVRAIWPPEERVCRLTTDCGREGTYVEGADYATGVSLSSNATEIP